MSADQGATTAHERKLAAEVESIIEAETSIRGIVVNLCEAVRNASK